MKGYRLQVLGYSFLIFVLLSTVTCTLYPALAADSTPSADIKAKLEELKKEIASKAALLKQEVNRKLKDKAYVGKIKSKSDTSFTLAGISGPKIISINTDTVMPKKAIGMEDYIAALGDIDEIGVLIARKIVLLPPTNLQPKTFLWGQIISISDKLITLKTNNLKNMAAVLPDLPKVKLNDFVILTGSKNNNDIFEGGFVYVIPQGGIIKPKKMATSSAQIATASAKPASPSSKPAPKKVKN